MVEHRNLKKSLEFWAGGPLKGRNLGEAIFLWDLVKVVFFSGPNSGSDS